MSLSSSCDDAAGPRPDIVLVVVDTLRADHLGTYGFGHPSSPHLDRFAEGAVVFERAIAASSRTAPSHASMLTSLWVRDHAIGARNGDTRLDTETTLAEHLRAAGYETGAFIGNVVIQRRVGLDRGFDVYDDELPEAERNRPAMFERTAERTTERALAWYGRPGQGERFLWVHYQDPHGPYTPPRAALAGLETIAQAEDLVLPRLDRNDGRGGVPAYQALPDATTLGGYRLHYAGEIAYFDDSFGAVLAAVKARGRPTIVAVTSDHGESMGEGGYFFVHGHATTPDVARVPFLLRAPGLTPERRHGLVHHVDLLPTVLELVGLPVPREARGVALGPLLRASEAVPVRTVFCDIGGEVSAYQGDRFVRQKAGGVLRTFRWKPSERWLPGPADPAHRAALEAYVSRAVPVREVGREIDDATRERLRALGYLEPDEP